jgi:hypothetical protein
MMELGRLALRVEGKNWVAYWAPAQTTMEGAVYLGSINMALVERGDRKEAFIDLMRECFADEVEKKLKIRPIWKNPVAAPDHERSGEA